ncbi:globin isoform X2 [Photinus pyralis]|uniref:globin isoform X2 n=1 Tax=Photinus pyralis TaxID=7054 RepID=UPI0012677DAA|nr:globin isoform X2 [Photinus pyralis]
MVTTMGPIGIRMNKVLNLLGVSHSNEPDPETGLTRKEKHLVERSWNLVKTNLKANGMELFLLLFKECPEAQNYFPFRDIPLDELPNNGKFKAHAVTVMYSIGSIVDNLNENDVLIGLLQKNAESHSKRGIPEEAYWTLKKCMMQLLKNKLGPDFSKEVEEAWDKTLTVAFTVIIKNF